MALYILFTKDGIPGWIGDQPIEGSEEVEATVTVDGEEMPLSIEFLARHRRDEAGEWVLRPPPPPPTAEDVARQQAERDRLQQEEEAHLQRWREEEVVRRSGPDQLLRSMGKITIAELAARVAAIRAEVEKET